MGARRNERQNRRTRGEMLRSGKREGRLVQNGGEVGGEPDSQPLR